VGIVTAGPTASDLATDRLRAIIEVIDAAPLLDSETMALIEWAARYYHHPPGEAYLTALPTRLRRGDPAVPGQSTAWHLTDAGRAAQPDARARRAPRQRQLLEALQQSGTLTPVQLAGIGGDARSVLKRLVEQDWRQPIPPPITACCRAAPIRPAPHSTTSSRPARPPFGRRRGMPPS